ncbi:MAG: class I SAM-dependent methyltransferase [Burkholderiales bacterium]|nr:class I SAM-dependent methyltransferase [Burkholderiales bacterium]
MWDERYAADEYVYGTLPNDFLVSRVASLPRGRVLCLGEGEGRNATWLAQQGFEVHAVDASAVGMEKARRLAHGRGVAVATTIADLATWDAGEAQWDAIVSIFCHLPPPARARVHGRIAHWLRPGGVFLLEAYTPDQLALETGGPPVAELMMTLAGLRAELAGLAIEHGVETVRRVVEGRLHHGDGAVVQVLARRPA